MSQQSINVSEMTDWNTENPFDLGIWEELSAQNLKTGSQLNYLKLFHQMIV